MTDMAVFVWTTASGQPRQLGTFMRTGDRAIMSYDRDAGDLPGLSIIHDTSRLAGRSVAWAVDPALPLPPCLSPLVPPRNPENLQRRILLRRLQMTGGIPADPIDLEWSLLKLAGRGGVGHLAVFASPDQARAFYGATPPPPVSLGDELWPAVDRLLSGEWIDPLSEEALFSIAGAHPSAVGIMPKLLLPVIVDGETVEVVAKFRDDRRYPGVLHLENLCLDLHEECGFRTPRHWLRQSAEGTTILLVERFDRRNGLPVPLESAFSALNVAFAGKVRTSWTETGKTPSLEMLGALLTRMDPPISICPKEDAAELYGRLCLAFLTGNGDTHLENFAFLGARGERRLSPVFDPAPMRGYMGHRMFTSVAFGGLDSRQICRGATDPNVGGAFVGLAKAFGLRAAKAEEIFRHCRKKTADYPDRVEATKAPQHVKRLLLGMIEGDAMRLEKAFDDARGTAVARSAKGKGRPAGEPPLR